MKTILLLTAGLCISSLGWSQKSTAYYAFINGLGSDHSGSADATLMGGVQPTEDKYGAADHALIFDGVDDYLEIPANEFTQPQFPFSISFWVNLDDANAANRIINGQETGLSNYTGYWINTTATDPGKITLNYGSATGSDVNHRRSFTSSTVLNSGEWYHVTAVFISHTNVGMYINGQLETIVESGSGGDMVYLNGNYPTQIGRIGSNYLSGKLDNIAFYNKYINSDEALRIYHNVARYEFDNQNAEDLISESHGVINGATFVDNAVGDWYQAVQFDGVDDQIDIAENSRIQPNFPLSVSMWINLDNASGLNQIFSNENNPTSYSGFWINTTTSNPGKITLNYGDRTGQTSSSRQTFIGSTTLQNNQWYHIVGVIRGHQDASIYIDGVAETLTSQGTGGLMDYGLSSWPMTFGERNGSFFAGKMDEIYVYDYALTLEDVSGLYNDSDPFANIDNKEINTIQLYPNPVTNQLFFKAESNLDVTVFDLSGEIVLESINVQSIDCSSLNSGIYIVQLKDVNGLITQHKIVKQ